jgi:type VI protein secretion system component Hcp
MRSPLLSTLLICLVGLAGALIAPSVNAQGAEKPQGLETFMHIDGIVGDSLAAGHVNDIRLTSYSQTFAPKTCSRVVALKFIDRASPALISRAANNQFIPSVVISVRKAGSAPVDFFKAVLESVTVERVDVSGESCRLVEQVVLKPRIIRIEFRPQDATGQFLGAIVTNIDCI